MKPTSPTFHSAFKLNGIQFETVEELLYFAHGLLKQGDAHEISIGKFLRKWFDDKDYIIVKTSGTTGEPKEYKLLKRNMIESAKATATFFHLGAKNTALLCLSADYIAGKMMLVRALVHGWNLHVVAPEKDALTQYDNDYDFAAMVPYQVLHSLNDLNKVRKLIVGGGPITPQLEQSLQEVSSEVFETYGMTETATHVGIRRVNGMAKSEAFYAMPDVSFAKDYRGCLVINAPKISANEVVTNDLVELHSKTSFTWLGRFDNVINSAGVKIFPEKVEDKLSEFIDFPFIIASEANEEFGEQVVLIIEHNDKKTLPSYWEAFSALEKYERPKKIYTVSEFPFTETEKIKRADVLQLVHKFRK